MVDAVDARASVTPDDFYQNRYLPSLPEWFPLAKRIGVVYDNVSSPDKTEAELDQLRRIQQLITRHLEAVARKQPRSAFVLIRGLGYVQVQPRVVIALSQPGISLGTPFGLDNGREGFYSLAETYGLSRNDWISVLWAGTAEEALKEQRSHKL